MLLNPSQSVSDLSNLSEGSSEHSDIISVDLSGGVAEIQTVVCPATAGMTQADYFVAYQASGTVWAVWLDKDANGTAPTGAAYAAAAKQVPVGIVTGDTAAQVAAKVKTAVEAFTGWGSSGMTISIVSATLTFTQTYPGDVTAPAIHNADDSGDGSFTVNTGTAGVSPSMNSKYFLFSSHTVDYYAWFNINSKGSDPAVAARTGAAIALTGGESSAQIATAAASVIDALSGVNAESDGSVIKIFGDDSSTMANASAGNSGLSVEILSQGLAASNQLGYPAGNQGGSSNNPSSISGPV